MTSFDPLEDFKPPSQKTTPISTSVVVEKDPTTVENKEYDVGTPSSASALEKLAAIDDGRYLAPGTVVDVSTYPKGEGKSVTIMPKEEARTTEESPKAGFIGAAPSWLTGWGGPILDSPSQNKVVVHETDRLNNIEQSGLTEEQRESWLEELRRREELEHLHEQQLKEDLVQRDKFKQEATDSNLDWKTRISAATEAVKLAGKAVIDSYHVGVDRARVDSVRSTLHLPPEERHLFAEDEEVQIDRVVPMDSENRNMI